MALVWERKIIFGNDVSNVLAATATTTTTPTPSNTHALHARNKRRKRFVFSQRGVQRTCCCCCRCDFLCFSDSCSRRSNLSCPWVCVRLAVLSTSWLSVSARRDSSSRTRASSNDRCWETDASTSRTLVAEASASWLAVVCVCASVCLCISGWELGVFVCVRVQERQRQS